MRCVEVGPVLSIGNTILRIATVVSIFCDKYWQMVKSVLWACCLLSWSALCSQDLPTRTVEFEIHLYDIHSSGGVMVVAVYDNEEKFLTDESLLKLYVPVLQSGQMRIPVASLPQGTYALAIFHDEDDDGELDKNWLGIPKEPIGFSNDAKGRMGPPRFEDAAFSLSIHHQSIKITLY